MCCTLAPCPYFTAAINCEQRFGFGGRIFAHVNAARFIVHAVYTALVASFPVMISADDLFCDTILAPIQSRPLRCAKMRLVTSFNHISKKTNRAELSNSDMLQPLRSQPVWFVLFCCLSKLHHFRQILASTVTFLFIWHSNVYRHCTENGTAKNT